jgi:hypothetical protein
MAQSIQSRLHAFGDGAENERRPKHCYAMLVTRDVYFWA